MGEISWKTASHPLCQVLTNFRASAIYVIHKHMILVLKAELPVLLTLELRRSDRQFSPPAGTHFIEN